MGPNTPDATSMPAKMDDKKFVKDAAHDAETAFTCVAARRFALPSCRHLKALSSRFSDANCSTSEGIRLSGERVITRVDSFHSTSPSSPLGRTSPPPHTQFSVPDLWLRTTLYTL